MKRESVHPMLLLLFLVTTATRSEAFPEVAVCPNGVTLSPVYEVAGRTGRLGLCDEKSPIHCTTAKVDFGDEIPASHLEPVVVRQVFHPFIQDFYAEVLAPGDPSSVWCSVFYICCPGMK